MPSRFATARAVTSRRAMISAAEARTSATTAGGAVSGLPALNGGSGAYCI